MRRLTGYQQDGWYYSPLPERKAERGLVGWDGTFPYGERPCGVHPLASVGGPPESRDWKVGDASYAPGIAASALVHAFCTVDAGTKRPTRVGERSFLQARVHLGHDVVVGDDCEVCVGVVLCGFVEVGDGARIGGNAWVKPRVKIGAGAIIGGGAVVTKDVPAHTVWAGNPARQIKLAWTHPNYNPVPVGSSELEQRQRAARWPRKADILEYVGAAYLAPDGEPQPIAGLGFGVDGDYA